MSSKIQSTTYDKTKHWGVFNVKNTRHLKILSVLKKGGIVRWNDNRMDYVADMYWLSDFLKTDKSPIKKPLQAMEDHELSILIVALEGVTEHRIKKNGV